MTNDLYIGGFIPLVYSLHFCFLCLSFALSLVHKHFTLKFSLLLFLVVKLAEIMFFYFYALYMQNNDCFFFSSIVHIIFDLTVYHLLLDILQLLNFDSEDFRFDIARVTTKEKHKAKIIFNVTLLGIAYISSV